MGNGSDNRLPRSHKLYRQDAVLLVHIGPVRWRTNITARFEIPTEIVAEFCQRHQIRRLALVKDSPTSKNDVNILVEFAPDVKVSLFRLASIEHGLSEVLDRPTHMMTFKSVERSPNPLFREAVFDSAEIQYEQE